MTEFASPTRSADVVASEPFVGRAAEKSALRAALSDVLGGTFRLVLIAGEPGIGKTRLATECIGEARAAGATIAWGACAEDVGAPPYWPWRQLLRAATAATDAAALLDASDQKELLAAVLPELCSAPRCAAAETTLADDARFALAEAVTRLVGAVARLRPLLIVLDDLHAADLPSLQVLLLAARTLSGPVLLVGTYRDLDVQARPEHQRLLHSISRQGIRLSLGGLNREEIAEYLRGAHADFGSPDLAADLQTHTGGNPLFVQEMTRRLLAVNGPNTGNLLERWSGRVPDGVRSAIRERLLPLSASCRRVLAIAAVVGQEPDGSVLRAVCEPEIDALAAVEEAVRAGLMRARPGTAGGYSFVHALVREALYDDIGSERCQWHRRIAAALVALGAGDQDLRLSAIAYHYWRAAADGEPAEAVRYGMQAAERAGARWAFEDAIEHYEQVLDALRSASAPLPRAQCEATLALATMRQALADPAARATFEDAAEMARHLDDAAAPTLFAQAALGAAARGFGVIQPTIDVGAAALLETALTRLPAATHAEHRARVLGRLAMELAMVHEEERALACSAEAVQLARRVQSSAALPDVLSNRYEVLWNFNRVGERLGVATEVVQLAAAAGDRELELRGRGWRLVELMAAGDLGALDREQRILEAQSASVRQPRYHWVNANARAVRAMWSGSWEEAERWIDAAAALSQQSGDLATLFAGYVQRFYVRRERGESAVSFAQVQAFIQQFPANPVPRCFLGIMALDAGKYEEAHAALAWLSEREFVALRRERRIGLLPYVAELCVALDAREHAPALRALLQPYADFQIMYGAALCLGSCERYLAQMATLQGDAQAAKRGFEIALERNLAAAGRPLAAWTQFDFARALLRLPHDVADRKLRVDSKSASRPDDATRRKAEQLLAEASRTAESFGMRRLTEAIRSCETQAGDTLRLPAAATTSGVFQRNGDVWLISDGRGMVRLKDGKGLRYIALLLQHPGEELAATELAFGADGARLVPRGEPLLDAQARQQYRHRLLDLRSELAEAESGNDLGRCEVLRGEMDSLTDELARAVGLHGRDRISGSVAERARLNVTRAIKAVVQRLGAEDQSLGRYFETTIKTGRFCSFNPEPRQPIDWQVGEA